jgi:microcystin-dependent protein
MTDPFIAEIRIMACNYAPYGWALCNGQIIPIQQNTALFSLIGTRFGGNGTSNFALPNLQGAAALHWGQGRGLSPRELGELGGTPVVTLTPAQVPAHSHALQASAHEANLDKPGPQNSLARSTPAYIYKQPAGAAAPKPLATGVLGAPVAGGNQPHNNMMPFLPLNFCIALQGVFPQRP